MAHSRIKSVINIYSVDGDRDSFIEKSFSQAVNDTIEELEDQGCKIIRIGVSTLLEAKKFIKNADILYSFDKIAPKEVEELNFDEEEEEKIPVAPTVGEHPKKVTEEVFSFVHEMIDEDYNAEDIADMFKGQLSVFTIRKILNTKAYSDYYSS